MKSSALKKKKFFNLSVKLISSDETFKLENLSANSKISDVHSECEITTGLPGFIQQLYYLDKCDLVESSTLQNNDVVSGAVLTMEIWHIWKDLLLSVIDGNIEAVLKQGVTKDSDFLTPSSKFMGEKSRQKWLQERADMSLFLAVHRGHLALSQKLIKAGANVNWQTRLGRAPLHVAAARDRGSVIDLLLQSGADINITDSSGLNPGQMAGRYGHKTCERRLFMFKWKQRAASAQSPQYLNPPPMAFQLFDTYLPQWKVGPAAQLYIEKKMPPGEYIGSSFDAPKRSWHRRCSEPSMTLEQEEERRLKLEKSISFDKWMKDKSRQQKINEDIRRKQEELDREAVEEKRRARAVRVQAILGAGSDQLRDVPSSRGGVYDRSTTDIEFEANWRPGGVGPTSDTKARIKDIFSKFGLIDNTHQFSTSDHESDLPSAVPKRTLTVYQQWQKQRKNMGMALIHDEVSIYGGYLPYQQMIREFCSKKCCKG